MEPNETETIADHAPPCDETDRVLILVLRLAALMCFAGWIWVHFYWEAPYGILLWHDRTYEFASQMGIRWEEFVGTGTEVGWLQKWIGRIAWLYLACTLLTLTVRSEAYFQMAALVGGSGLIAILSYAKYVASERQLPMFVEHGGQILAPVLLVMALCLGARHRVTVNVAILALIMTFAGHGSYAIGWWPTPGTFYAMTCVSLGVEYETAHILLRCFGILDFVVCIALLVRPLRRSAAMYAVLWGFLTSAARPYAGMSFGLNYWGADQYLHEAVLRAPHFLIPLYLVVLWGRRRDAMLSSTDQTLSCSTR